MKPPYIIEQKLAEIGKEYPDLNEVVNELLHDKGVTLSNWPDYVFLPMAAWYAIVANALGGMLTLDTIIKVSDLAAFGTWRYSQGVYRFDDDLFETLVDTDYDTVIPVDVIQRLPQFCCYIETVGKLGPNQEGFFVFLEYDMNTFQLELRFQILYDTGETVPLYLPLKKDKSINELLQEVLDNSAREAEEYNAQEELRDFMAGGHVDYVHNMIKKMLPMVLYLCSDKPDIDNLWEKGKGPSNPIPKKVTGNNAELFPAQSATYWAVGRTLGQVLRDAATQKPECAGGTHANPGAHVRRGHWHGYWTEPKSGDSTFVLKWLHPMLVGMEKE